MRSNVIGSGTQSTISTWLQKRPSPAGMLLVAPAVLYLTAVYLLPLSQVLLRSITQPQLDFGNYVKLFTTPIYGNPSSSRFAFRRSSRRSA